MIIFYSLFRVVVFFINLVVFCFKKDIVLGFRLLRIMFFFVSFSVGRDELIFFNRYIKYS